MTPEASLQNRGKRESRLRWGTRLRSEGGAPRRGNTFLPAPGPLRSLDGPSGPRAHADPAARARHLRERAASSPSPPQWKGSVLHPTLPLPRLEATAGLGNWSPAGPGLSPRRLGPSEKRRPHSLLPASCTNQNLRRSGSPPPFPCVKETGARFNSCVAGVGIYLRRKWMCPIFPTCFLF